MLDYGRMLHLLEELEDLEDLHCIAAVVVLSGESLLEEGSQHRCSRPPRQLADPYHGTYAAR